MRYLVLAALLFVLGIAITQIERENVVNYTPIVRVRTADGLYFTVVQRAGSSRNKCNVAVDEMLTNFASACVKCIVESSECASRLQGLDLALALDQPVPIYTVAADGVRIGILGPPNTVKAVCENVAGALVGKGVKSAACAFPPASEVGITLPKS